MNKQFIITNFAAFALMLFLPTGCRQADGKQDAVQSYRVIKVAASPVEISESYSAAIRGRQDVDILPQISGRIIRLKVKEGERVKTGQVLAVIDQVPYRAALRTAQANVSAAQAKVETARIELRGKQALFDEKVISDYELSLARNQQLVTSNRGRDQDIVYGTYAKQVVDIHDKSVLGDTFPHRKISGLFPVHIRQGRFGTGAIRVHNITIFRITA